MIPQLLIPKIDDAGIDEGPLSVRVFVPDGGGEHIQRFGAIRIAVSDRHIGGVFRKGFPRPGCQDLFFGKQLIVIGVELDFDFLPAGQPAAEKNSGAGRGRDAQADPNDVFFHPVFPSLSQTRLFDGAVPCILVYPPEGTMD